MDSEEEEETVHLLVELSGLPSADAIKSCQGTCAVLGIDSEEPLLQLDNYVFKGRYEDILGTAMIFQHDKGRRLKYMCKTGKKLTMQRVFLKKKDDGIPSIFAAQQVTAESKSDRGTSLGPDTSAEPVRGDGSGLDQSTIPITTLGDGSGDQGPIPMSTSSTTAPDDGSKID